MMVDLDVPTAQELYDSLPLETRQHTPSLWAHLLRAYDREIAQMVTEAQTATKPQVRMTTFATHGHGPQAQSIADFAVKDLARPEGNSYNWHLQNTSQWVYAGAILVQNGEVSTHH